MVAASKELVDSLEWYFRSRRWGTRPRSDAKWDEISPATIGRLNLGQAAKTMSQPWMQAARRMLLTGEHELTPNPDEQGPPPEAYVDPWVKKELEAWAKAPRSGNALLRRLRRRDRRLAPCGAFPVEKKGGLLRAVFDARCGNRLVRRLEGFRLFSCSQLHDKMAQYIRGGEFWVQLVDFRHFFYQLPLHPRLQPLFVLANKYCPTVWPMGFACAPMVAQCLSWSAVLHREKDQDRLGTPAEPMESMPEFLTLRDAAGQEIGAIFVLLDNILVVTKTEADHHNWAERLRSNIALLNLEVKPGEETTQCHITGSTGSFVFAGHEFAAGAGWRSVSAERNLPQVRTRRDAASLAGMLGWEMRVREASLLTEPGYSALMTRLGTESDHWDGPCQLDPEEAAWAERWTKIRASRTFFLPEEEGPRPRVFAATDATPTSVAWTVRDADSWRTPIARVVDARPVAENELLAVVELAETIAAESAPKPVLIVATDSMVVVNVVRGMYSRSEPLRVLLRRLLRSGVRVEPRWVPTDKNVADTPSRDILAGAVGPLDAFRGAATWAVLASNP